MAGPMPVIDTLLAGVGLDVSRQLNLGDDVILRLIKPDQTQIGGIGIIRDYSNSFDRIPEAEAETGDGSSIVFDLADNQFPEGQVEGDLEDAEFVQLVVDGVGGPLYPINDAPKPAINKAQVWRITCQDVTFKQTFIKVGKQ